MTKEEIVDTGVKEDLPIEKIQLVLNNYRGQFHRVQSMQSLLKNLQGQQAGAGRDGRPCLIEIEVRTAGKYTVDARSIMALAERELDRLRPKLWEYQAQVEFLLGALPPVEEGEDDGSAAGDS